MKLGELRGLIRKTKGNPIINIRVDNASEPMRLTVQKTSLLAELDRLYPGGKSAETGHTFDEATGVLTPPEASVAPLPEVEDADDDLLLDEPAAPLPADDDDDLLV